MASNTLGGLSRWIFRGAARLAGSNITAPSYPKQPFCTSTVALNSGGGGDGTLKKNLRIDATDKTGVVTMTMNRPPANTLNLEFLQDIAIELEKLEHDPSCRALILASDNPKIFSAGLEITEMYNPNVERLREFWRSLQEVWLKLYCHKAATFAAIEGHAPAGGCLLALCTDYRVMAEGFTIGLNETQLGIVAPFWFKDTMKNTVGQRETEYALQLGKLYSSQEALEKRLVDKVVPQSEVMDAVNTELKMWLRIPDVARQISKHRIRRKTLERLQGEGKREEDINNFVNFITHEAVQKSLGMYLENLKNKKK